MDFPGVFQPGAALAVHSGSLISINSFDFVDDSWKNLSVDVSLELDCPGCLLSCFWHPGQCSTLIYCDPVCVPVPSACWGWPIPCWPVPCGPWWPLLSLSTSWALPMACEYFHGFVQFQREQGGREGWDWRGETWGELGRGWG